MGEMNYQLVLEKWVESGQKLLLLYPISQPKSDRAVRRTAWLGH